MVRPARGLYNRSYASKTKFLKRGGAALAAMSGAIMHGGSSAAYRKSSSKRKYSGNSVYGLVPYARKKGNYKKKRKVLKGRYSGRVQRKGSVVKPSPYLTKGFINTCEVVGTIDDPDVVYAGHSCVNPGAAVDVVVASLLRNLFADTGVRVNSITDTLYSIIGGTTQYTNNHVLEFQMLGDDGTVISGTYLLETPISIYTIVGDCTASTPVAGKTLTAGAIAGLGGRSISENLIYYMTLATATFRPYKLNLYEQHEEAGTTLLYRSANIMLCDAMVHYWSKSAMKIQNRSVATDGDVHGDAVSNTPIAGKVYRFVGVPKLRSEVGRLDRVDLANAISLVKGSLLPVNLREPVKPAQFKNCKSYAPVVLQPGMMKSEHLAYTKVQRLWPFLNMTIRRRPNTSLMIEDVPGPFSLFGLEDIINLNSTNKITLAYEVNRQSGCYITYSNRTSATGLFTQNTYDAPAT